MLRLVCDLPAADPVVVETGMNHGFSTIVMAQVLKDAGVLDGGGPGSSITRRTLPTASTPGERYEAADPVNLETRPEISIRDLAGMIAELIEFEGTVRWNTDRPDLQPPRADDVSRAERAFRWRTKVALEEGLRRTIDWYRNVGLGSQASIAG